MAAPHLVAALEDVMVRFRRYCRERQPDVVWSVASDLNGLRAVEKKLCVRLKSEEHLGPRRRETTVVVTVRDRAGRGLLVAGGKEALLPADDPTLEATFAAIIRQALEALDDQMPSTRP